MVSDYSPQSLASGAYDALVCADLDDKVAITNLVSQAWRDRRLSLTCSRNVTAPARPGRQEKQELLPPAEVPKRPLNTAKGRLALIHAIAHIELNAIDLALDIIVSFTNQKMPRSFFDGWMKVMNGWMDA